MAPDVEPALLREIMLQIDAWRRQQAEPPSRSEAIRRLIDLGLEAAGEGTLPDAATDAEQAWPAARGWIVEAGAAAPEPVTPSKAEDVR